MPNFSNIQVKDGATLSLMALPRKVQAGRGRFGLTRLSAYPSFSRFRSVIAETRVDE